MLQRRCSVPLYKVGLGHVFRIKECDICGFSSKFTRVFPAFGIQKSVLATSYLHAYICENDQLGLGDALWYLCVCFVPTSASLCCLCHNLHTLPFCTLYRTNWTVRQRTNSHKFEQKRRQKPVAEHFNLPGHSLSQLTLAILQTKEIQELDGERSSRTKSFFINWTA
jgi:hypothetical protein